MYPNIGMNYNYYNYPYIYGRGNSNQFKRAQTNYPAYRFNK